MKTNDRLLLTALLFVGLLTRPVFGDTKPDPNLPPILPPPPASVPASAPDTNLPPPPPPPTEMGAPAVTDTSAPAAKPASHKKKSTKATTKAKSTAGKKTVKKAAVAKAPEISVPLKPGAAEVTAKRVNLRGQPTIASEVLGRLTNGEPVTVIEELRRNNKRPDDPDVWAKITLPASAHTWVHGTFVDTNKTVTVKKLNIRGGPGENYSIVGQLKKGDTVTQLNEKNGWLEITPPADAYVYVAAAYLRQEAPIVPVEPAAAPAAPEAAPTPTTVAEGTPMAAAPTEAPATPPEPTPAPTPDTALASSPAMPPPNLPVILDPSIKRVVDREGLVRHTWSIQAPSDYRLVSPDTGENIVYLHTDSTNLDLSRYKGLHIIVTGEEGMDRRWKNTPVLTIRRIQVIE